MKSVFFSSLLVLLLVVVLATANTTTKSPSTGYSPNWPSIDSRPLPTWYDQAKIGVFIHWGVFSVPSFGSEWFWWYWQGLRRPEYQLFMRRNYRPDTTYPDLAHQFTAEFYDPNGWADLFKAAGAKYVVLTSKHHEGFCLWPSKFSWNWNAGDVGPKRDLLGELATAIRSRTDLRFGLYHSWFEWFNPLFNEDKFNQFRTQDFVKMKTYPELVELVNRYKPEVVWSDGDEDANDTYWRSTDFLAWLYNDSPVKDTVVVNDRWGNGTSCKHGGYYSCQDRFNPGHLLPHKWENAMTLDRDSWGYRRDAQLNDYLTIEELIKTLAETVSCNGNLLINVGPTADGRIVPIQEERLRQLGQWLSINGEAIYGSRPWRWQNDTATAGVWYTSQPDAVYAIVLNWPSTDPPTVWLGAVEGDEVSSMELLGVKGRLQFRSTSTGAALVTLPKLDPNTDLRWAWVLKIVFD